MVEEESEGRRGEDGGADEKEERRREGRRREEMGGGEGGGELFEATQGEKGVRRSTRKQLGRTKHISSKHKIFLRLNNQARRSRKTEQEGYTINTRLGR